MGWSGGGAAHREAQLICELPYGDRTYGDPTFATCVAFDPASRFLVCGGEDGRLRLFDLDGKMMAVCEGHEGWISSVSVGMDGSRIVSAAFHGTIRLWDPLGNAFGSPLRGHDDIVTTVAFAANGTAVVSGSADGTVRMWDSEGLLFSRFRAHRLDANGVTFVRNGAALASVGADRKLGLWQPWGSPDHRARRARQLHPCHRLVG